MKEKLVLTNYEKQLLNQRNLIETVFDCLKHKYHVWHTRHRSMLNAMTNLMAALAAYTIEPLNLSAFKLLEKQQPVIVYQSWNSELGFDRNENKYVLKAR